MTCRCGKPSWPHPESAHARIARTAKAAAWRKAHPKEAAARDREAVRSASAALSSALGARVKP